MSDTDDQISMDLGVEVEPSAWARWVDTSRQTIQARKFMDYAGILEVPAELWTESESPELMAERKSADAAVAELFPDMAAMRSTERADMADAYLCFLGQCFANFARASWYDSPVGRERSFYPDVNPALHYGFKGSTDQTAWQLMEVMFEEAKEYDYGLFSVMVDFMGEYKEECKFVPE